MNITAKYKEQLDKVRLDISLLNNYKFISPDNSKHFERLRLNIALFNDLQQSDYEIARSLFDEECKWRKNPQDGEVDNLYFSAFILTRFNNPEIIWQFFDAKNIDFDSGIGFDGEYLLSIGINETYDFISKSENSLKSKLLEYIGERADKCSFSQDDINQWIDSKKIYFKCYTYPIEDEIFFLYATNEKELFNQKFPDWIVNVLDWNYNNVSLYKTYANYTQNVDYIIKAYKHAIERGDRSCIEVDKIKLGQIYIETGEYSNAVEILKTVIKSTQNINIIRDCIEQFCCLIIKTGNGDFEYISQSIDSISRLKRKYKKFSPKVDELIEEVNQITDGQIYTVNHIRYKEVATNWFYKFFNSN